LVDTAKARATLNIDADLHQELKIEAAKRGMKLGDLAELLLRDGLKRRRVSGED